MAPGQTKSFCGCARDYVPSLPLLDQAGHPYAGLHTSPRAQAGSRVAESRESGDIPRDVTARADIPGDVRPGDIPRDVTFWR